MYICRADVGQLSDIILALKETLVVIRQLFYKYKHVKNT